MNDENENKMNRRSLLKSVGLTTGAGVFTTGFAEAKKATPVQAKLSRVEDKYRSVNTIRHATEEHAKQVLNELSERNLITKPEISELKLNEIWEEKTLVKPSEKEEGVAVTALVKDRNRYTSHLMISKNTESHRIGIYLQPEVEQSYAIVVPKDSQKSKFVIDPSTDDVKKDGVACPDSSYCGSVCESYCPDGGYDNVARYKVQESCYSCGSDGTECCCYTEGKTCDDSTECYCWQWSCPGC